MHAQKHGIDINGCPEVMTAHETIGRPLALRWAIALIRMRLTDGPFHAATDRE
jgi:hypothetical protein